jgi:hypothetical protein
MHHQKSIAACDASSHGSIKVAGKQHPLAPPQRLTDPVHDPATIGGRRGMSGRAVPSNEPHDAGTGEFGHAAIASDWEVRRLPHSVKPAVIAEPAQTRLA